MSGSLFFIFCIFFFWMVILLLLGGVFMSVTKSLNIQGTSMISFDDAIKTAYEEVATSIDHIFDVEVIGLKCTVQNHKIQEYIADTKIYFKIDTERARENGRD